MKYIITGSVSFLFLFAFDYYNLNNKTIKKRVFSILGFALFIFSFVMVTVTSPRIYIVPIIRIVSLVICLISIVLLVYSLFIEVSFNNTYIDKKFSFNLVDTGTYALTRHPGVLWLFIVLISVFLDTGTTYELLAAVIWTTINSIYVYAQEKFIFCKMFTEYSSYKVTTPMLIPNVKSIKRCLNTTFEKGEYNDKNFTKHDSAR